MYETYSYSQHIIEEYAHINEILNDIKKQFDVMIERHNKVLLVHFVLRFPVGYVNQGKNSEVSEFIKKLKNHFEYQRIETRYIWVREQNTSEAPHYHVALLLNGSKRHHTPRIWDEAAEIWSRVTGGPHALLHRCWHDPIGDDGNGGIMIRRPSGKRSGTVLSEQERVFDYAYTEALNWTSYLAKRYSKE